MVKSIVLGGGCFWCIEAVFSGLQGVISSKSGYSGGHTLNPTYQEVCTKNTGHAEVVLVEYDEMSIDLETLLKIFFTAHDPTQVNRQGNDIGPQYRSCIYTSEQIDERIVVKCIEDAESLWGKPLATTINTLEKFWPAESEHDNYFSLHPEQPYCAAVVSPKVAKVRATFSQLYQRN